MVLLVHLGTGLIFYSQCYAGGGISVRDGVTRRVIPYSRGVMRCPGVDDYNSAMGCDGTTPQGVC